MRKVNKMDKIEQYRKKHLRNVDIGHKLEDMLELQKTFGKKFVDFGNLTIQEKERWTKEFIVCCMDEMSEILNWTSWKHWKQASYPVNEIELKYEIIDLWHFVMSLMLVWEMDAKEIYSMYLAKNRENHNRQMKGY